MVGSSSSKILTVSYGTFSCTLEGFDDPFSTMRHIAEYFRDLAADDRYFGAEPPTPDAEMLHRIAEREIQRRVESRVTGENVVLRQLDTGLAEDEAEEPAASTMNEAPQADRAPARAARSVEADAPAASEIAEDDAAEDAPEKEAASRSDSIEEKLSRIRAVVERTRSRDIGAGLASAVTEQDDADDEALVADMSPGFAGDIDATLISQVMAEQATGDERVPDEDGPVGAEPLWDFDESLPVEHDEAPASEDIDSADGWADEEPAGDDARGMEAGEADAPVAEGDPDTRATLRGDDAHAQADLDTDAAIARVMDRGETAAAGISEDADDDLPPLADDEPELVGETEPEIVLETDDAETDDALASPPAAEAPDGPEAERDDDALRNAAEHFAEDAPEAGDAERLVDDVSGEEGRVSGEDASGEDEDEDDDLWDIDFDEEARAEAAQEAGDPDGDAGDAAGRALDLESGDAADRHADAEADAAPREAVSLAEARADRSLSKSSQLRAPEEESARIVSRTETAFAEGEGSRRRSAIAHLKAAVAATRADKILSRVVGRDRASDPAEQKDYRDDLSMVVKPHKASDDPAEPEAHAADGPETADADSDARRDEPMDEEIDLAGDIDHDEAVEDTPSRPDTARVKTRLLGPEDTVSGAEFDAAPRERDRKAAGPDTVEDDAPSAAAEDDRAAPLMLVSALRVEAEDEGPVRPRRVSRDLASGDAARGAEDVTNFKEFAERMGANDLTDLMEAAAAYTAFVEGEPHFSRPQIMRRVAKVDPTIEDSREAGLRSFGQLLRQGRIQKLQRGQFTVSETTRFKPEQRIAGE